jgi:tRNA pseudouridine55 synthase
VSVDGLINLNKPAGISSARALDRVRRLTGQRKSGHAGTLDVAADGVLLICLGRATKLVERLMNLPKVYRAAARLDVTSPGLDSERDVTPVVITSIPGADRVREVLMEFEGLIDQTPPAFSALKIAGRPAYKLARRGQDPELKPRRVRIDWIRLRRYAWPELEFDVCCGRGTYVRALIRDIGARLQAGGCLTRLTRLEVGPFTVDDAWAFGRLEAPGAIESALLPMPRALEILETATRNLSQRTDLRDS